MTIQALQGNAPDVLRTLAAASVQACLTSPPYFQLRAYGTEPQVWGGDPGHFHDWHWERIYSASGSAGGKGEAFTEAGPENAARLKAARWRESSVCECGAWRGELGQESTPELFVAHLVGVFREVRRVLKPDGCLLLNIGDSYAGSGRGPQGSNGFGNHDVRQGFNRAGDPAGTRRNKTDAPPGYKAKDLYGIPWMLAFALRADGWWLRGDYIWAKPNPMPESMKDRCTRSHEYIFHLTKSKRAFWNADAIREPIDLAQQEHTRKYAKVYESFDEKAHNRQPGNTNHLGIHSRPGSPNGANKRSVWTVATAPFSEAHFATFPPDLAELMVKATTRPGDTVLDPFGGAATTALAADRLGRHAISIELNADYAAMQRRRLLGDAPMFVELTA